MISSILNDETTRGLDFGVVSLFLTVTNIVQQMKLSYKEFLCQFGFRYCPAEKKCSETQLVWVLVTPKDQGIHGTRAMFHLISKHLGGLPDILNAIFLRNTPLMWTIPTLYYGPWLPETRRYLNHLIAKQKYFNKPTFSTLRASLERMRTEDASKGYF